MNYIIAHKAIQLLTKNDIELRPIHKSLLDAIFMYWNSKNWVELFNIDRDSLMEYSKISNRKTYYETLSFLQVREYIIYKPSKNPDVASIFGMGKKVTSAITSTGSSSITSANTSTTTSAGSSGGTIYINLETIKPKTLKLINDNASLVNECLEYWILNHAPSGDNNFEKAWEAYGKKGNKKNAKAKWSKVTDKDFNDILAHIPAYLKTVSDRKFLKDFERYISSEHWKSVITPTVTNIHKEQNGNTMSAPQYHVPGEILR